MRTITLAGRGSRLAQVQNEIIREKLEACGYTVKVITVITRGDRERHKTVMGLGGGGPFVREVERALLTGEADIAVHCAKDLPYELADGLCIAGVPDAADPRDCLLLRRDVGEGKIRKAAPTGNDAECVDILVSSEVRGAEESSGREISAAGQSAGSEGSIVNELTSRILRIGTGSPRRVEALRKLYPNVECLEIRGNITTRLKKLRDGIYDGIVLAKAGLDRTGLDVSDLDVRIFTPDEMVPAVGQGLLVCECREEDEELRRVLEEITPPENALRFQMEREIFCRFRCDCRTPVGIYAQVQGDGVKLYLMHTGERSG